jgi:hypothetical protein
MPADPFPPVPPMTPVDDLPPERASWPKVVGVISIVYSALFLTCSGCGIGMLAFIPKMMAGQPGIDEGFPPSMQMYPLKIASFAFSMLMLVVLLVAGITTVMRRPVGRPLHLLWGVLSLVVAIAMLIIVTVPEMSADVQWYKDHPGSPFAKQQGNAAAGPIKYATTALFVLLGLAWPTFCLIWFGLVKKDSKDLDGGGEELMA